MAELVALSSESSFSAPPTEASSNVASLSSTPPTSASPDNISLSSDRDTPKPTAGTTTPPRAVSQFLLHHSEQVLERRDTQAQGHAFHTPLVQCTPQLEQPTLEPQHNGQQHEHQEREAQFDLQPDSIRNHDASLPETRATPPQDTTQSQPRDLNSSPATNVQTPKNGEQGSDGVCQQTPIAQAIVVAASDPSPSQEPPTRSSSRRTRVNTPVYNLSKLSGTDVHGKRRAKGDAVREKRQSTAPQAAKAKHGLGSPATADQLVRDGIDALDIDWSLPSTPRSQQRTSARKTKTSPRKQNSPPRRATRRSGLPVESLTAKVSALGKRSRKTFEKGVSHLTRELKRLQDTDEFAHIDKRPVIHTVWSNGKFVDPRELEEEKKRKKREGELGDKQARSAASGSGPSPAKKARRDSAAGSELREKTAEKPAGDAPAGPVARKPRMKIWLEKGLYAGQEPPANVSKGLTAQEKKLFSQLPEFASGYHFKNKSLPLPMFNGLRLLIHGRDFKLPFDICNPLPPGQPKPAAYRTMTRNRFVGDAGAYWKKTPHFKDFQSKCVCTPEDGCGEQCQNRIMLYECDETNCNVGKAYCANRAFQNLQERTKQGGRFRVGVEVFKTADRGYGVRSNRCFEPNQIIMEYTGEIITEEECERRMNEVYRDNECYYLMSFDQNMIIDATTGSIARFVNHSCSPNCRMIKWIVSGQPRMALFAGDRPIMTGEELTYDYNFDPFSAKNVQKCLCGSDNCRGVLGPKHREAKQPKQDKPSASASKAHGTSKTGKRKLKDIQGDPRTDSEGRGSAKRPKLKALSTAAGGTAKRSLSVSSAMLGKAARGAATAIKRSVSSMSVGAKSALSSRGRKSAHASSSPVSSSIAVGSGRKPGRPRAGGQTPGVKTQGIIRTTKAAIAVAARSPGALTIFAAPGRKSSTGGGLKAGDGNKRQTPTVQRRKKTPHKASQTTSARKSAARRSLASPASAVRPKKATTTISARSAPSAPSPSTPSRSLLSPSASSSLTSSRKRIPSRKLLESVAAFQELSAASPSAKRSATKPRKSPKKPISMSSSLKKKPARSPAARSPRTPKPRKALDLSRSAKIRLVESAEEGQGESV